MGRMHKPLMLALGAAVAGGLTSAQASIFQATDLGSGYMVAASGADKTSEAKCGEAKCGEGKCGEGRCGGAPADSSEVGKKAGSDAAAAQDKKKADAKCGEGKCGGHPQR